MKKIFYISIFLLLSAFDSYPLIDSMHYNWVLYEYESESEGKKCYITSKPIKSDSDHGRDRAPYIMVTKFQNNQNEEVGIFSDFEYKLNSKVRILIDDFSYKLFTKKDMAWIRTKEEDKIIIKQMLKSKIFKVRSDSIFGTYAIDQYSMKGFVRAYNRMKEICKIDY
jgi:hypothetical protein